MARYIDADKLKEEVYEIDDWNGNSMRIVEEEDIENAPTEDVRPVVRGEWIKDEVQNHIEKRKS